MQARLFLTLFACLLLFPPLLFGQTAKLTGTVKDAATGEALVGASVGIQGTRFGTSAKANGTFEISGLPEGTYKVTARYIGYQPQTLEVTLSAGSTAQLDFALRESVRIIDEVVVTASKGRTEKSSMLPLRLRRQTFKPCDRVPVLLRLARLPNSRALTLLSVASIPSISPRAG